MTHLRIELNTITENVTSNVIHKLYETAKAIIDAEEANDVQESLVSLKGNLLVSKAYGDEIDWLEAKFPDLHITAGTRYIRFADPEVLRVLLANNIGDGTGVTNTDAAAVTYIDGLFKNNTTITSFNELRYFTNDIQLTNGAFLNTSNLLSIDLSTVSFLSERCFRSSGITGVINLTKATYIQSLAFNNCINITEVNLGVPSVTMGGGSIFAECSNLLKVTGLSNITTVPEGTFNNCLKLNDIDIDFSKITRIYASAFLLCKLLTGLDLSNVVTIDSHAFNGCTALTSVDLSNCTSIGNYAFNGCTSLGEGLTLELNLASLVSYPLDTFCNTKYSRLIVHSPLQTNTYDPRYPMYENMNQLTYLDLSDFLVGPNAFDSTRATYSEGSFYNNTSLVTFIYPLNVNAINQSLKYGRTVSSYRYAIILSTTPPTIDTSDTNNPPSEWFVGSNLHIYVPDSAKSAYLADTDWASIGGYNGSDTIVDRLHGLSELPAGVWTTGLASLYLTAAQLATS